MTTKAAFIYVEIRYSSIPAMVAEHDNGPAAMGEHDPFAKPHHL